MNDANTCTVSVIEKGFLNAFSTCNLPWFHISLKQEWHTSTTEHLKFAFDDLGIIDQANNYALSCPLHQHSWQRTLSRFFPQWLYHRGSSRTFSTFYIYHLYTIKYTREKLKLKKNRNLSISVSSYQFFSDVKPCTLDINRSDHRF